MLKRLFIYSKILVNRNINYIFISLTNFRYVVGINIFAEVKRLRKSYNFFFVISP